MTLSCCGKSTGKSGCALARRGCYPNAEASKRLMGLVLLCEGEMHRVLRPGWDEFAGGLDGGGVVPFTSPPPPTSSTFVALRAPSFVIKVWL